MSNLMSNMVMHAGGRVVDLETVKGIETPRPTRTHRPIPHTLLLDTVTENLNRIGFEVEDSMYALKDGKLDSVEVPGAQFFALMSLKNGREHPDYSLICGLRNAHDKASAAKWALGSRVFVCDNMAFSGEVVLGRKHTSHILRDLPRMVQESLVELPTLRKNQESRIEAYKSTGFNDNWARCAIMRAAEEGCIAYNKAGKVWNEWKNPRHEEFAPRTAWSLFNGFTEVLKDYQIQDLPRRSMGIHELLDPVCKVELN